MLKLVTNSTGFANIVIGCPFCDLKGTEDIVYKLSTWHFDPDRGDGRLIREIKCCPFCGEKLPPLDNWKVVENI